MTRRAMLQTMGGGFGMLGLAGALQAAPENGSMAPGSPHFPARAKHVIFLFLNGGLSQVDSFDPKPELRKRDGQPMPGEKINIQTRVQGNLMDTPYSFRKYGQSGLEVSEIFPKVGQAIDNFCVIRSMYTDNPIHESSVWFMNSGHRLPGRPSLGSWVTYGLGTENQNLPGFVVLCPGYPIGGPQAWSSAFLPNSYQGVQVPDNEPDTEKLIQHIRNTHLSRKQQESQLELLGKLNRSFLERVGTSRKWREPLSPWRLPSGCRPKCPASSTLPRKAYRHARVMAMATSDAAA